MKEVKTITQEKKGYGYEKDNPIEVFQMLGCQNFFSSLRNPKYPIVRIVRTRNVGANKNQHIIDEYAIFCLNTNLDKDDCLFYKYLIYVDMYSNSWDDNIQPPEDFVLVN